MGIRFLCEHCQSRLNVKAHQAGMQGVCPKCGKPLMIPTESTLSSGQETVSQIRGEEFRSQNTSQFSQTEVLGPEEILEPNDLNNPALQLRDRQPQTQKLDDFTVTEDDTNDNASDDSISLAPSSLAVDSDSDSFMLGKPSNKALAPDGPDPIEENPNRVWYIRHPKHSEIGPLPGKKLAERLSAGKVLPGSYLWREDWHDWEKASDVFPEQVDAIDPAGLAEPALDSLPGGRTGPEFRTPNSLIGSRSVWMWAAVGIAFVTVTLAIYLLILSLQ